MKVAVPSLSNVARCAALLAAIAAAHALGGCASNPARDGQPELAALGAASTSDTDPPVEITGSRIPKRRSEKMVSQIGGQDYQEFKSSLAAPLEVH